MQNLYGELSLVCIRLVFSVIGIVLTSVVVPWVKTVVVPWLKDKHLYTTVVCFVQAAEKMAESGQIPKESKKQFVVKLLESKGVIVDAIVDAYIESAVEELDMGLECLFDVVTDIDVDEVEEITATVVEDE